MRVNSVNEAQFSSNLQARAVLPKKTICHKKDAGIVDLKIFFAIVKSVKKTS